MVDWMSLCCRYLVTGSDSASLYLEVLSVQDQDIICQAQNSAVMDGLMTVSVSVRHRHTLMVPAPHAPLLKPLPYCAAFTSTIWSQAFAGA